MSDCRQQEPRVHILFGVHGSVVVGQLYALCPHPKHRQVPLE
jgi:hypothetical protein